MICLTEFNFIDLPLIARRSYGNNASAIDLASRMPSDVDIPRLKEGKVGGFFWYASSFSLGIQLLHDMVQVSIRSLCEA